MTVTSTVNRNDYNGNGFTTLFPVAFRFLHNTHLQVLRTVIATNVTTVLTLDSLGPDGFSVTGAGQPNGGTVTVVTPPVFGERLSILRNMPFTQLIDYIANDPFPAESHERGLDERTMENQQLREVTGRAIVLPPQTTGVSTELPGPVALNLLRWNAAENALENAAPPAIATVADGAVVDATVSPIAGIQSSKLSFTQAGTGAVPRTVQAKLRDWVHVADFGAVEDGVANDSPAFQAAIDSIGAGGGVVRFSGRALLSSGLVMKEGVTLQGTLGHPGIPGATNSDAANIWNLRSTLLVPSAQTIVMRGSSCLDGLVVRRSTMTGPENDATAYAGTAVTVAGEDVTVRNVLALGFNRFVLSDGFARLIVEFCNFDCINGVSVNNSFDVTRIHNVHGWPFGTIDAPAPSSFAIDPTNYLFRNGTAFNLTNGNDWTKITDCFSYGYLNGYIVDGPANVTLTGCGADNISSGTNVVLNSAGFVLSGVTNELAMTGCQAAAQDFGYSFFASSATQKAIMTGCTAWGIRSGGLRINDFDVAVANCSFRGRSGVVGQGIVISGTTPDVEFDDVTVQDFNDSIVGGSVRTVRYSGIRVITCANNPAGTLLPQVASADPLPLMQVSQYAAAEVTGNNNFGNITPTYAGHVIVLKFTGTPTAFDGGNALLNGNFVATPDDTLTLACDGLNWYEVARSAN